MIDNDTGLVVTGAPVLEEDTVRDGAVGLHLTAASSKPVLVGNTICGNVQNLVVGSNAEPPDHDGSNEICDDASAE